MPLKKGYGKKTIQTNIEKLIKEGYKHDVASAIAYGEAGKSKDKKKKK